jgi:hypothetical protein
LVKRAIDFERVEFLKDNFRVPSATANPFDVVNILT